MTTTPYHLRIPEEVLAVSKIRAEEEHLDQSTTLKQFLHAGAEEYILKLVKKGRISIGKAAEILKKTVYDIQRLAKNYGVELGPTTEQTEKSIKTAKKLFSS
ncbi:hypothetical protein COV18_06915 [Candidatus Woesearchaeota archaeon CG10_big_fil_rev_8_21_14_0_10_37_12]|nr:MAG: hypothetical protein COV18_06915 [Candidatus Woesearchaeota archaeon CG10_big_fil_rev_8_21_14_0_10_37_12]